LGRRKARNVSDDVESKLSQAVADLMAAVGSVEADLDEIEPDFAVSQIPADVPSSLERLAAVIRELPGSWR
jgi:hypothetical protein